MLEVAEPGGWESAVWLRASVSRRRSGRTEVRGLLMCRRPPVPLVRGVGGFVTAVKGGDTEVVLLPLPALEGIVRRRATEPTALGAGRLRRRCSGCLADEVPALAPAVAARGVLGGQGTAGLSI